MKPRLHISFPLKAQWAFCCGLAYTPKAGEFLINHARTGIVMALRASLPQGGRVGVVAYNCHTVANAVMEARCTPVFIDVTEDLHINLQHLATVYIDAIVVTNLFGIHNDISAIRAIIGGKRIIVDNAHGYGLPAEGDFMVYSINQGKFPALGEGGILLVNDEQYLSAIQQQYNEQPEYTRVQELKLFGTMLIKAILHLPCLYGMITRRLKAQRTIVAPREIVTLRRMAKGVSRMYQQALPNIDAQIRQQKTNAQQIADYLIINRLADRVFYGENAFMLLAHIAAPNALNQYFAARGVETATHFSNAIEWAKQFGYAEGQCPTTEKMTKELLMIPTYKMITL